MPLYYIEEFYFCYSAWWCVELFNHYHYQLLSSCFLFSLLYFRVLLSFLFLLTCAFACEESAATEYKRQWLLGFRNCTTLPLIFFLYHPIASWRAPFLAIKLSGIRLEKGLTTKSQWVEGGIELLWLIFTQHAN